MLPLKLTYYKHYQQHNTIGSIIIYIGPIIILCDQIPFQFVDDLKLIYNSQPLSQ